MISPTAEPSAQTRYVSRLRDFVLRTSFSRICVRYRLSKHLLHPDTMHMCGRSSCFVRMTFSWLSYSFPRTSPMCLLRSQPSGLYELRVLTNSPNLDCPEFLCGHLYHEAIWSPLEYTPRKGR